MRRRAISALAAALALVLTLVTPALAAGRPNWDGPLGAMAGPVVCETGRDYVLYYTIIGGVYRSADGVTWTELDRQWASAGWAYGTGVNGLAHKEFQFLWTGSEYMMRQSLLDDPREDTHQQYGDSPRNNWVTLLDEDFRIIGAKAFDGPVTDIRYAGGHLLRHRGRGGARLHPDRLGAGPGGRRLLQRHGLVQAGESA